MFAVWYFDQQFHHIIYFFHFVTWRLCFQFWNYDWLMEISCYCVLLCTLYFRGLKILCLCIQHFRGIAILLLYLIFFKDQWLYFVPHSGLTRNSAMEWLTGNRLIEQEQDCKIIEDYIDVSLLFLGEMFHICWNWYANVGPSMCTGRWKFRALIELYDVLDVSAWYTTVCPHYCNSSKNLCTCT